MYETGDRFIGEWTHAERSEYGALKARAGVSGAGAALPPLVRETLLAMREESPEDEDLAWALEAVGGEVTGAEATGLGDSGRDAAL